MMKRLITLLLMVSVLVAAFVPQTVGAEYLIENYTYTGTSDEADPEAEALLQAAGGETIIQNYPMPSIYTQSEAYSLRANEETIPVVKYLPEYDYAQFSFAGTVTIEVTANQRIESYSISPLAKNIKGTVDGNKLTFTLSTSTYVIVDINERPNENPDEKDPSKIRKRLVIAADPLETDIPDASGEGIYNVLEEYNADNTGETITSGAIQQAIDDAHAAGGGIVYIPAGVYKSSNIILKSNVTFYLAGGAVIVGTGRGEDYTNDFRKDSISDGTYFIRTEIDSENITMRGRGTIDGKGVEMRRRKMTDAPPTHKNGEGFINNLLVPMATSNFKFDGLTLRDGGFWAFMVVRSDNVTITNYKGYQDLHVLEDDAIDINESQNVLVKHAIAISDDDTFSTKTWPQKGMSKNWPGAIEHLENVTFDDCLAWTRCAAFKLGMGICTAQIGVSIRNSYVYQSARALLVDHAYTENPLPEEGYALNVTFENIDIERVGINQFGNYWFRVSTSTAGDVSNILFKNINVRQTGGESPIQGNPTRGGMVNGVTFTDIYVGGKLAKSLSDMKAAVKNDNVTGLVIANTVPAIFSDNFDGGTIDQWVGSPAGEWTVSNDGVLSTGTRTTTYLITANAGASWTNYSYEARTIVPLINGEENSGLVFRVQDDKNFYMYRINAKSKKLELYKSVSGTMTPVADTPFTPAKEWYTVKVVVHGNTIRGYVDGVLMTEWTNPADELTTGGVGFRTTSAKVLYDDAVVSVINEAPTDIVLSQSSIAENTTPGGIVGMFSTVDADVDDTFAYALAAGEGDTDNGKFSIAVLGNALILRTAPDYETKSSYNIRVRSTDAGGLYVEKSFAIQILDQDETPVDADLDAVLFSDDFEDGNTTGWTTSGGSWSVTTTAPKALVQKSSTTALIMGGESSVENPWTDYVYQADVKVPISNANAGLVFRVLDNKNFYMYRLNATTQKLELYKCVDGVMALVSSTAYKAVSNQWYTLKVIVQGNTIIGYVDGERKVEWTNPAAELPSGRIGFRTTSADASFDNALAARIKSAVPSAAPADASKNTVTLDRSEIAAGETVTITAAGHRQTVSGSVAGDERFIPTTWVSSEADKSGSFVWNEGEEAYISSYAADTEGEYVITVTFQKQSWDGTAWNDGVTDAKTANLTVGAEDDDNGDGDGGSGDGGNGDGGNGDGGNGDGGNGDGGNGDDGNGDSGNGSGGTPPVTGGSGTDAPTTDLGTAVTTQEDGKAVTTISVDPGKLEQQLSQESNGATITIPVNKASDKVVVELTGQMVKNMEAKDIVLQISTEKGSYTLSADLIHIDAVSGQLGSDGALQDIKIRITIAAPAEEVVQQVQDTAKQQGHVIVALPVEFSITASSGSHTVDITKFNGYVARTIALPEGTDADGVTTGVVLNADGSYTHVPTKLVMIDGKPYAQINSLTNSVYSVIYSQTAFSDIGTHWAKDAIRDLGSRLVIAGKGDGRFEPDRDITRAEFAAIIVRGLGLGRPGSGLDIFKDVTKDDWYYDAVAAAHEYGIIDGYEDGTFRPMAAITREQAMTMAARAMTLTGLQVELTEKEAEQLLSRFEDAELASDYAASSIASAMKVGIITGRDDRTVAPKNPISRAEVAVIITRLLQQSGLI